VDHIPTDVREALMRGQKIAAIKALRERADLSLTDAKRQVEQWTNADPALREAVENGPATVGGPFGILAFVIVMVMLIVGVSYAVVNR